VQRWLHLIDPTPEEVSLLAFTFPDHGSQMPGMGANWADHPSWELVELASDAAGRDVASLLLDAGPDELNDTVNAQVATFVLSLVAVDAAERLGLEPAAAAGRSLGEYTALVATGALSIEDGVRLVVARGAAMRAASENAPGSMATVLGLGDEDVEVSCVRAESDVWIASYDAPGHVVVSGTPEGVERAGMFARSLGAEPLRASSSRGAFHSPLMLEARDPLRKALSEVEFLDSNPVVVANVDARRHPDPTDWPGLLSAQLCAPIRWRQTIETLYAEGARTFVELGPGSSLTTLTKRSLANKAVPTFSIESPLDLEALFELMIGASAERESTPVDRSHMTERLVVAPTVGPFRPVPELAHAAPKLAGVSKSETHTTPLVPIKVGDLIGWVGDEEIRSSFEGSLEGLLVLTGERVITGQPVAWLSTSFDPTR
jgi:[acyl-carrier-protein] S-malonyltransferase